MSNRQIVKRHQQYTALCMHGDDSTAFELTNYRYAHNCILPPPKKTQKKRSDFAIIYRLLYVLYTAAFVCCTL